jgi:bifunctional DNA-binding transcriptional regulator/antitoxin component of YhaV-PrlF toxin-antitoxin module
MLCKVTSKNQITLPKELMKHFANREYFDAKVEEGHIILEPVIVRTVVNDRLAAIRQKIAANGIAEANATGIIDEAKCAGDA